MSRLPLAVVYAAVVAALIAGSYHTYWVHEPVWRRPAVWMWGLWIAGPVLLGWALWAKHLGPGRAGAAVGGMAAYNIPGLLPCDGTIQIVPLFGLCAGAAIGRFLSWSLQTAPGEQAVPAPRADDSSSARRRGVGLEGGGVAGK